MADTDRVERLMALLLLSEMKSASQQEKAVALSIAGFTNYEIADLLQTTAAVVSQSLYAARKQPQRKALRLRSRKRQSG
jgi:predicted transcriptional regulator